MSRALGRQNHKVNCFCVSGDGLTSSITAQGLLDGVKHVWNSHSFFTKDLEYRWVLASLHGTGGELVKYWAIWF